MGGTQVTQSLFEKELASCTCVEDFAQMLIGWVAPSSKEAATERLAQLVSTENALKEAGARALDYLTEQDNLLK